MPRVQRDTNGYTPLADTATGAAGTVTGGERTKLQQILEGAKNLATATLSGLMSAADKVKLDGIRVGASQLVTGIQEGIMPAADKAKLDAAVNTNTANAIVRRDASGNFAAGTITAALAGNASTATSATNATNANYATTAGDLSPSLNRGSGVVNTYWNYSTDAAGKRIYSMRTNVFTTAAQAISFGTFNSPDGLSMIDNLHVSLAHYCTNSQGINVGLRGPGNTDFAPGQTTFEVAAQTIDGTNLNTKASKIDVTIIARQL